MNSNRNESFINTASKLLEKVKQQQIQQNIIEVESSKNNFAKATVAQNGGIMVQPQQQPTNNIKC